MDAYYSRPEVSNSDLSSLKKYLSGDFDVEPVEAYRFGRLLDCMITEPQKVDFYSHTCNGEKFSSTDFLHAENMRNAFYSDPLCKQIIQGAQMQKEMSSPGINLSFYNISFTLPVRCKWDVWLPSQGWGADIKTTTATTHQQFIAACSYFDYDRQRAWYMDIAGSHQDMLIGISKVNYKVFKLSIRRDDDFYLSGREKYTELAFKWWLLITK